MSYGNVPDDWNCYYTTCHECGSRYHESEGGCGCWEERLERKTEELLDELRAAKKIELVRMEAEHSKEDDIGSDIRRGEQYVYLFVELSGQGRFSYDEYALTEDNWEGVMAALKLTEEPPPPEDWEDEAN